MSVRKLISWRIRTEWISLFLDMGDLKPFMGIPFQTELVRILRAGEREIKGQIGVWAGAPARLSSSY